MRATPLLITIILLLAGLLAYEFWQDGRLPFLSGQNASASDPARVADASTPPPPTAVIMQCEGNTSSETWGLRGAVPNGAHYFTLRIQGDGSTEATNLVNAGPVNRGRWTGELADRRFSWTAPVQHETLSYSSTVRGSLNLDSGEYSATLVWAPLGPNLEKTYTYYGYCRVAGAE